MSDWTLCHLFVSGHYTKWMLHCHWVPSTFTPSPLDHLLLVKNCHRIMLLTKEFSYKSSPTIFFFFFSLRVIFTDIYLYLLFLLLLVVFYVALFSALKQTRSTCMWFYTSKQLFTAHFWISIKMVYSTALLLYLQVVFTIIHHCVFSHPILKGANFLALSNPPISAVLGGIFKVSAVRSISNADSNILVLCRLNFPDNNTMPAPYNKAKVL